MSNEIRSYLSVHPLMQGLAPDQLDTIAARGTLVNATTGQYVLRSGDHVDSVSLVISGRLAFTTEMPNGQEKRLLSIGRGSQIGVMSVLLGEASPVNVLVEESTRLIRISAEDTEYFAQKYPVLRRNFLRAVGNIFNDQLVSPKLRWHDRLFTCVVFDEAARGLLRAVARRLADLGENIAILTDQPDGFDERITVHSLLNAHGECLSESQGRAVLADWSDASRIFIEVDNRLDPSKSLNIIAGSDQVWWACSPKSSQHAIDQLEQTIAREPAWREKSALIWTMNTDDQIAPFIPKLSGLVRRDFKVWPDEDPSASFIQRSSLERLIHSVRGVQIGLAFGGGAARGMAHLGVLQALEDAGIVVDMISGTSAGVLTSLLYCAGYSPQFAIDRFTQDLKPGGIYSILPKGSGFYMLAKFRGKSWDKMLRKYLFDWRLEQCPIPGFSVATDLVQSRQVIRESGDIVHSILESINLPVLSPPICRDGMALIDGGILNVLPADVLVNRGCSFVIGVNVSSRIQPEFAGNTPDTPTAEMKTPGMAATLFRTLNVLDQNMSAIGANVADFTIEPDVSTMDMSDFENAQIFAEIGRQQTESVVENLKQMLHRLDDKLFP